MKVGEVSQVGEVADEVVGQVQVGKRSQLGQTLHCNSQSGNYQAASHCYLLDSVVVKKEAFEEAEVVEPLDGLDAVVLEPEALQVSVLLQVLNLRESLQ